jgi:hypothetical protein
MMTKASSGYHFAVYIIVHHILEGVDFSQYLKLTEVNLPRKVERLPLNWFQFYPQRLYPMAFQWKNEVWCPRLLLCDTCLMRIADNFMVEALGGITLC